MVRSASMRDAASRYTSMESAVFMGRASMRDAARELSEEEPAENMAEITVWRLFIYIRR